MGQSQGRAVKDIKPLLHLIQDIGREINVEEQRLASRLDPKATGDLSVRLRKNIKAAAKQHPVGLDPREIIAIGNKHR